MGPQPVRGVCLGVGAAVDVTTLVVVVIRVVSASSYYGHYRLGPYDVDPDALNTTGLHEDLDEKNKAENNGF